MEEWINAFLKRLENKNFSLHTIRAYQADLQEFLAFFKARKQNDLKYFTSANIRSFLAALQTHADPARNTVLRKIASLRSFAAFLLAQDKLERNPFKLLPAVKRVLDAQPFKTPFKRLKLLVSQNPNIGGVGAAMYAIYHAQKENLQ